MWNIKYLRKEYSEYLILFPSLIIVLGNTFDRTLDKAYNFEDI